jgi:hypothetical protein
MTGVGPLLHLQPPRLVDSADAFRPGEVICARCDEGELRTNDTQRTNWRHATSHLRNLGEAHRLKQWGNFPRWVWVANAKYSKDIAQEGIFRARASATAGDHAGGEFRLALAERTSKVASTQ